MVNIRYIIFSGLILVTHIFAQQGNKIDNKRVELKKIKYQINQLEADLQETLQKEKKSIKIIETYNKQNLLINKLISSLHQQESEKKVQISETTSQINTVQSKINRLKDSYAKSVEYQYKYGDDYEWNAILSSDSFNKALIRYKYFRKIAQQQEKDLTALKLNKEKLLALKNQFEKEQAELRSIAKRKEQEEKQLKIKITDKRNALKILRGDKQALQKDIELKKQAEDEIKGLITKLIVAERRKKKEEEDRIAKLAASNSAKTSGKNSSVEKDNEIVTHSLSGANKTVIKELKTSRSSSRLIQKGSLLWPINGTVIRNAGENVNNKLNTVTLNYGIDIRAGSDHSVLAVTGGEISAINWVPGYGSVIIITHKNGFRSVYGHLSEIFVKEGDQVDEGTLIGKVGESLEGFVLHFELWIDRNYQNPEVWLSRR